MSDILDTLQLGLCPTCRRRRDGECRCAEVPELCGHCGGTGLACGECPHYGDPKETCELCPDCMGLGEPMCTGCLAPRSMCACHDDRRDEVWA